MVTEELTAHNTANVSTPVPFSLKPIAKAFLRGTANALLTILVIIFLTLFGLEMAARGRAKIPAPPLEVAGEALVLTWQYLFTHPLTYQWTNQELPAFDLVFSTLKNSAGLLLTALLLAAVLGIALGLAAARMKGKVGSALVVVLSVLGMSTPTFLLGMFLWMVNIYVIHRALDLKGLPSAGFGWDTHLIMPAIVLAMRPMAQIAQVTYVSLRDVLGQDYIRTAHAKGASARLVNRRHALRNIQIPVLTTIGTSLRYSLASLPVVETFFNWPGVGVTLLGTIRGGNTAFTTDLIVSLGLFFLVFNLFLDLLYPYIDPRLRKDGSATDISDRPGWREALAEVRAVGSEFWNDLLRLLRLRKPEPLPQPKLLAKLEQQREEEPLPRQKSWPWRLRLVFSNPSFLLGSFLILALAWVAVFGSSMTDANPYQIHGVQKVDGIISSPPFKPSGTFPWGTDHIGRDVQSFVLAGARPTLILALFAMLARVTLGTVLGILAGWMQDSWFDRFITRLMSIWAAFPLTIFAMLVIEALGIQQGMWVFVVALCVVGWGEVTQFVRAQTIRIKPQPYIEAARALGARPTHLLAQQVFPNLVASIIVIAALEMGGILLLLAELGYLNIFLGGGFSTEMWVDKTLHFSDVPEWGAMLANIRQWWRSYPWMAWYPGVAFFLSIIAFNLFGEGMRHFLEESRVNLSRLLNRYTFLGSIVVVGMASFAFNQTTPLNLYRSQASEFDANAVLKDIAVLSSPALEGRMTGTPGHATTAAYIEQRMREIGLFPTNLEQRGFQRDNTASFMRVVGDPLLEFTMPDGRVEQMGYQQDFVEFREQYATPNWRPSPELGKKYSGPVVGVAVGPLSNLPGTGSQLVSAYDLMDTVVITYERNIHLLGNSRVNGILVVADQPEQLTERYMLIGGAINVPVLLITPEVADQMLQTTGTSLAELEAVTEQLDTDEVFTTARGTQAAIQIDIIELSTPYTSVIGVLPGTGAKQEGEVSGVMMDAQAIIVAAYFDGLGTNPAGVHYPGANDNASGVGTMLEIARLLKQGDYQPKKTLIFIAWTGGEDYEKLSITQLVTNNPTLDDFKIEGIIELSGMGAGSGRGIAIGDNSGYRMLSLFQKAAAKIGVSTTTRGRSPHYGMPEKFLPNPRTSPSLYLSWDGSDQTAHLPGDDYHSIDAEKLRKSGQSLALMLSVMSREPNW